MFNSICVVCIGNICRSPIGERLLAKALPNKQVSSAGLAAEVDEPAYSKSISVASKYGLSLDGHVARQLTKSICIEHDLILVMEKYHIDGVCRIAPEARGKVMLFGHWLNGGTEIADPYGRDLQAFEQVYSLLARSTDLWASKL